MNDKPMQTEAPNGVRSSELVREQITDTQRLDWLIKNGPPGACDDGFGLSESLWEASTDYVDFKGRKDKNTDKVCIRKAIDDAMFPNTQ